MRSRVDASRPAIEWALRVVALGLVAFALWRSLRPADSTAPVRIDGTALPATLPSLMLTSPRAANIVFSASPRPVDRDALRAVSRAGTQVTWSSTSLQPLAMSSARLREPGGAVRVTIAAVAPVELSDALAIIDSVVPMAAGSTVIASEPSGSLRATEGKISATVESGPMVPLHPVLVLGRASFEAKFVMAALEERGWTVDARLVVAPGASVNQGKVATVDTAHFSAVIALDTSLGTAGAQLARYVRSGGGLILLGDAANAAAVMALAPARAGTRNLALTRDVQDKTPLNGLPLQTLEPLRSDAVRLGARAGKLALAARREGAGRVLQVGYTETWRWRMQGGDDAMVAHRLWWSRLVASIAYADVRRDESSSAMNTDGNSAEGAPLARIYDAFGPPSTPSTGATTSGGLPAWLFPLICMLLLAEWASRRFRGVR